MSTIDTYFTPGKAASKRPPSDSPLSESSSSPSVAEQASAKQGRKQGRRKQRRVSESGRQSGQTGGGESEPEGEEEMETLLDVPASLAGIQEQLSKLCTKEDLFSLKNDFARLTENVNRRLDKFESQIFDLQTRNDSICESMRVAKEETVELKKQLEDGRNRERALERSQNDLEQYGRLWNVRVHGISEASIPSEETVDDCVRKCVDVFTRKLGVTVKPEDVEIAHRSGGLGGPVRGSAAAGRRPRPILLRFFSRQKKGEVLQNRRKLKQTGISVSEDLTFSNYKLLKQSSDRSATLSAWSSNGKVITKLKNGKTLRLYIGTSLDELFRREM